MAVAEHQLARRPRPSERVRKNRDDDPPQEGDADYGMREHRFRFFNELDADPDGWLQIFPMGKYTYGDIGAIEITPERCANFVKNFDENARGHALPVNREHVAELGAVGWFKELAQRDDGVWAKIDWTDDGKDLLEKKAFKFFSPEFYDEYSDPKTGETYKDLLVGCAITNYPRFFDMTPIAASEKVAAAMKIAADSFQDRLACVAEAIEELYGWSYWIEDTFEDRVICRRGDDWFSIAYTVDAAGKVTLGAVTSVERTFTPTTMAEWTTKYINDLPDSSFAYIEAGGTKEDGKTTPRSLRHFPIKDADGTADAAHVRNALSRAPQSPFGEKAMPKIRAAAKALGIGVDDATKSAGERPEEKGMATEVKPGEKPGTGDPATPPAAAKASEGVMISASELATLREQAAQAPIAMADAKRANTALRLMAANDAIDEAKRAGRLAPAEEDFWRDELVSAANEERFEKLKKHLGEKPIVVKLGAVGSGAESEADEDKRLDAAARKYMSEHKDATYRQALLEVAKEAK